MPVKISEEYKEAARRFHDNHPEAENAVHAAHLRGLNLSDEAQQEIVDRRAPEIAHTLYDDKNSAANIRSLPSERQSAAIAELHRKSAGRNPNEDTEKYLAGRTAGAKGRR